MFKERKNIGLFLVEEKKELSKEELKIKYACSRYAYNRLFFLLRLGAQNKWKEKVMAPIREKMRVEYKAYTKCLKKQREAREHLSEPLLHSLLQWSFHED